MMMNGVIYSPAYGLNIAFMRSAVKALIMFDPIPADRRVCLVKINPVFIGCNAQEYPYRFVHFLTCLIVAIFNRAVQINQHALELVVGLIERRDHKAFVDFTRRLDKAARHILVIHQGRAVAEKLAYLLIFPYAHISAFFIFARSQQQHRADDSYRAVRVRFFGDRAQDLAKHCSGQSREYIRHSRHDCLMPHHIEQVDHALGRALPLHE